MDWIRNNPSIRHLSQALNLRDAAHRVVASNLANAETPGFVPSSVSFDRSLAEAMGKGAGVLVRTHPRHLAGSGAGGDSGAVIEPNPDSSPGNDLNAVNIEREMEALAENTILYNAAAQILAKKFQGIREAIDTTR